MIYFHLGSHSRKLAFLLTVIQMISLLYLPLPGLGYAGISKLKPQLLLLNTTGDTKSDFNIIRISS